MKQTEGINFALAILLFENTVTNMMELIGLQASKRNQSNYRKLKVKTLSYPLLVKRQMPRFMIQEANAMSDIDTQRASKYMTGSAERMYDLPSSSNLRG